MEGPPKGASRRILRPPGGAPWGPPRTGFVFWCPLWCRRAAERAAARRAAGFGGRVNSWSVNPDNVRRLRDRRPGWGRGPTVRTFGAKGWQFSRPQCWQLRVLGALGNPRSSLTTSCGTVPLPAALYHSLRHCTTYLRHCTTCLRHCTTCKRYRAVCKGYRALCKGYRATCAWYSAVP